MKWMRELHIETLIDHILHFHKVIYWKSARDSIFDLLIGPFGREYFKAIIEIFQYTSH